MTILVSFILTIQTFLFVLVARKITTIVYKYRKIYNSTFLMSIKHYRHVLYAASPSYYSCTSPHFDITTF